MLIRDVAYATVPRSARRALHADVARSIEDAVGESAETLHSILAYHWSEGGEPDRPRFRTFFGGGSRTTCLGRRGR